MKKNFAFAALATLMLAGCSNEDDNFTPQVDNLKDKPITVSASVGELMTRAGYETPENGTAVLPETFYLTVTQEEVAEGEMSKYNYTDVKMTRGTGSTYNPEIPMLWKDETPNPSVIYAYTMEGTEVSVLTDQTTTENVLTADLLGAIYATENSDITISGTNIGIDFRHLLCKLDATFTWGTEFSKATKEIVGVTISNLNTTATLERTTAIVSDATTAADIKAYVSYNTAEAIFAPSMANPTITIHTLIDNVERTFTLTATAPTDGFVSGNRYTVNVSIGGTTVDNVSATVASGWGEPIPGDNLATK